MVGYRQPKDASHTLRVRVGPCERRKTLLAGVNILFLASLNVCFNEQVLVCFTT